jgi:hypothetical protein
VRVLVSCNVTNVQEREKLFIPTVLQLYRCFRLKKECNPSSSIRKKRATPRNSSQAARLERKLDGLVSLLKASSSQGNLTEESINDVSNIVNAVNIAPAAADSGAFSAAGAASSNSTAAPSPSSSKFMSNQSHLQPPSCLPYDATNHHNDRNAAAINSTASALTPASSTPAPFPYLLPRDVEPTAEEEKLWYEIFIDKFVEHAPFLKLIVQNSSCVQLRQERPFLWLSIMAVSCPFVNKQGDLGRAVREVLAREVMVEGERKIDFLLGGLCFAQWYASFLFPFLVHLTDSG